MIMAVETKAAKRRVPKTEKPTIPVTPETWADVDELAQLYELDKKVIAARVFTWLRLHGKKVQQPILRSVDTATLPDFARMIVEKMAGGHDPIAGRVADGKAVKEADQETEIPPVRQKRAASQSKKKPKKPQPKRRRGEGKGDVRK